nr:hypothetical protein GCM10020185_11040 [Pseudomonas brassicacearum subsp. brassicacearum]
MEAYATPHFAGLSYLGWFGFLSLWFVQALVFWTGMESIRRFIDWAGPVVYAVMFLLAGWIVWKAGWSNISFTLAEKVPVWLAGVWPGDRGDGVGGVVLFPVRP